MAKNKMTRANRKKSKGQRRVRRRGSASPAVLSHPYARTLSDPCQGPLISVYPGERGQIARFVYDNSFTLGGTETAYIGSFWPALNGAFNQGALNGSTVTTPSYSIGVNSSVGYNTINSAFSKARCISACVEITFPAVSALNIVGELATACLSADTFTPNSTGALSLTANDVFTMSPTKYMLQRKVYEQKFSPGSFDGKYNHVFESAQLDTSDTNALIYAARGLPAGTTVTTKWTAVYELTARKNGGLAASATNVRAGSQDTASNVAAMLHAHKPGWAASAKNAFGTFFHSAAQGFAQTAGTNAGQNMGSRFFSSASRYAGPLIEEMGEEALPLLLAA